MCFVRKQRAAELVVTAALDVCFFRRNTAINKDTYNMYHKDLVIFKRVVVTNINQLSP